MVKEYTDKPDGMVIPTCNSTTHSKINLSEDIYDKATAIKP